MVQYKHSSVTYVVYLQCCHFFKAQIQTAACRGWERVKGVKRKVNPTTQIPEMVFGHKPTSSEAVTARSAKAHADSHKIFLLLFNFLVRGKKSLTTWKVRN